MKEENQNVKGREITEEQIDFRALLFIGEQTKGAAYDRLCCLSLL